MTEAKAPVWETVNIQGALVTLRTPAPGGWLVLARDGAHSSLAFLPDPAGEWQVPITEEIDIRAFGPFLRLREALSPDPDSNPIGLPYAHIDINVRQITAIRNTRPPDNAPSLARSRISVGSEAYFVLETLDEIAARINAKR